ncbi:hypothetical protein [Rosistilla carotiformis]|uniref:hypothetical protein n=1 Tax=Rosistilla carotiformis TaxID=2528017 RepID=UPI0011A2E895|nr:hypothetical protein [Rosistilla carotiformis]
MHTLLVDSPDIIQANQKAFASTLVCADLVACSGGDGGTYSKPVLLTVAAYPPARSLRAFPVAFDSPIECETTF